MPAYGSYPTADALSPGDEISSTYEGRHIQLTESDLVHPSHTDGFVDKGDPIIAGENIVGVAFKSAAAATDQIAIDTEGIWNLDVVGSDEDGNSAVAGGDAIYINTTTAILSKIKTTSTRHFGYALGIVAAASTEAIAVKVHWDPPTTQTIVDFISQAVEFDDFTDNANTTGYIDLTPTLPIGAVPLGCKFVVATGFTGDTTAVVQAGISGDLDRFTEDVAQSVLAAATVGAIPTNAAAAGIGGAVTVRVTVTGGADFTSISAGAMTVYVYFLRT